MVFTTYCNCKILVTYLILCVCVFLGAYVLEICMRHFDAKDLFLNLDTHQNTEELLVHEEV
jgi:hypothetical protein